MCWTDYKACRNNVFWILFLPYCFYWWYLACDDIEYVKNYDKNDGFITDGNFHALGFTDKYVLCHFDYRDEKDIQLCRLYIGVAWRAKRKKLTRKIQKNLLRVIKIPLKAKFKGIYSHYNENIRNAAI